PRAATHGTIGPGPPRAGRRPIPSAEGGRAARVDRAHPTGRPASRKGSTARSTASNGRPARPTAVSRPASLRGKPGWAARLAETAAARPNAAVAAAPPAARHCAPRVTASGALTDRPADPANPEVV